MDVRNVRTDVLVFNQPESRLGVFDGGLVMLPTGGRAVLDVVLYSTLDLEVEGSARSLSVASTPLNALTVRSILDVGGTIFLDREARVSGSVAAPRLVVGPNFQTADAARIIVGTCEAGPGAPADICARSGL